MEMGYKEARRWGKAKNGMCGKALCPLVFSPLNLRFGERGIGIWVKKCNNSGGWLIPYVVAKGIDSGKNLHPSYVCIQRTSPIFSSSDMPSV